ncbi:MAG: IS110 family transposase [Acidimicrobiales bacterium]
MSPIVSEKYAFVIGVDTHAATHTFALIAGGTGTVLDRSVFPTTPSGLLRAVSWLDRRVEDAPTLVVVEGTGSFGAILTARLQAVGREVVEAAKMPSGDRRGKGKSDELDAERIARAVLGLATADLRVPRTLSTDQARVAMRVLVVAREQMTAERTRAINVLVALVRTIDLGIDARRPLTVGQIKTIAGWRHRDEDVTTTTCRHEATRLALRIRTLDGDLASNRADITELIQQDTPQLLELTGVGAVVAASVLIAWSHPGRVRSEAAMASLAGTSPIPASSGNTSRHRLNRGGDRRLNRAMTTITIVRMRVDPATRAYVARRRAEGRTTKEIMRSLKRYITRQLFRTLAAAHPIPCT